MVTIDDFDVLSNEEKKLSLKNKGFITSGFLNDSFYSVYKMYTNYLLDYLDEVIGLKSFDDILLSRKTFDIVNEEKRDIYQRFSKYNYFYIRNFLCIERLDIGYINELKSRYESGNMVFDDFAKELIKDTIKDVCNNGFFSTDYGPSSGNYVAPANAIVVGCRSNDNPEKDEDFFEWAGKVKEFYNTVSNVNKVAENKLPLPFKAFYYEYGTTKYIEDFS